MKLSRRGDRAPRTGRSKAAHNAVNRGRRSQTAVNMGRHATAAHWRFTPREAVTEEPISQLTPEELEWLRRKAPAKKGRT